MNWKLEDNVNDWVKSQFVNLGKILNKDYTVESSMSPYMKEALAGSAKTKRKTNFGKPDFQIESFNIPVIIENKLGSKKLVSKSGEAIKNDDASISNYAVNGAVYYAQNMIASGKYKEVIAIGVAGDNEENVTVSVYYIFGYSAEPKHMSSYTTFDFLENKKSFESFYKEASLSDTEKDRILMRSKEEVQKAAKELSKLMFSHDIDAAQRVIYVSGMLLAMQDIVDDHGNIIKPGLVPDDLKGLQVDTGRDSVIIVNQISEYTKNRKLPQDKEYLMLGSFKHAISLDNGRDKVTQTDKSVSKLLNGSHSINKQIFTYVYHNVFLRIDGSEGHLDIMGEMYSIFLKYALGDGKELGIVLTPPYVTKMMSQILDIDKDSKVMDLATGSAGFLISAMEIMIQDAEKKFGKKTTQSLEKIQHIKKKQLLGVELNATMFTLAATNMILRGDGSSNIQKGDTFNEPKSLYEDFKADRILLNPPFKYDQNGMPFIEYGLDFMEAGGLGAIIIQDSAGSGKAIRANQNILRKNQLLASIKMPVDLFQPMAGVQTSIYIFRHTGKPHDYEKQVRFIDFRNDGYRRSERSLNEIDEPVQRYQDIVQIYKNGKNAKIKAKWDLEKVVVDHEITSSGADWNFDQHQVFDTLPTEEDFKKVVGDYLAWEVSRILKADNYEI